MPYDITTKDGITLRNIPDDVAPDSPQLKARVDKIRSGNFKPVSAKPDQPAQQDVSLPDRVANFGRGARAAITAPLVGLNQRMGGANAQGISDAWREDMAATGAQPGGVGGQFVGGAASVAPVAMLPGANSIVGGGLYGLLQGFSMPTAEGESPLGNALTSGAAGAAIPAGIRAAKTLRAVAVDPFTEAGRTRMAGNVLKRAAGDDAAAVAQRLMAAKGNTPGFVPSVSQAAGNDGISAFERTMRAIDPQAFQAMNQEQKGALISALSSIAKSPEDRAIAVALRKQTTSPLYAAAARSDQLADPTRVVSLIDRMVKQNPANKALTTPLNQVRESLFEQYPALQRGSDAWKALDGSLGGRMSSADSDAIRSARTVMDRVRKGAIDADEALSQLSGLSASSKTASEALDLAKQYMKTPDSVLMQKPHQLTSAMDNIKAMLGNQDNAFVKRELSTVKKSLGHQIGKVAPEYRQAEQQFAQLSRPINQMDIGRELYNRFVPAIADQGGIPFKTGADAFSRALLRNGDQLARNVTGMKGATLSGIMDPEQLALLQGVSKDAGSIAASMQAGRGAGSDTVQKIAMSNIAQEAGIPTWVSNFASVPGGWAKRVGDLLYGNADDQVRMKLSYLMTHPQEAAQAMNAAGVAPSRLADLLKRGGQWGAMSVPPALQALSAE